MDSKHPIIIENEYEQVVQQRPQVIKRIQSSPVKCNYRNRPVVVFAHGSGACSTSEWMIRWRNLLANALNAVEVVTFDYPYINGGRKAAPKPETLVGFHSDIVKEVAAKYPENPLILVGKSMGSKISCMVASENNIEASAIVCLGYPLKGTKRDIWDAPLLQLTVPIMFVQGGKDVFCPLEALEVVRKKLKALNTLHVIEHADHSFQVAKKNLESSGMTREKVEENAAEAVAEFVSQVTNGNVMIKGAKQPKCESIEQNDAEAVAEFVSQVTNEQVMVNWAKQPTCEKVEENAAEAVAEFVSQATNEKVMIIRAKPPTRKGRKRKSERILKKKLRYAVYDKDGRGSTIDKPFNID